MFRADNIASLTDSWPRNINIKHRKSVSQSISVLINTASHRTVACFVSKMYISHFRSKFISQQGAPIQRNIKINANRPESAASFCATSSHHRVAIQLLIRRPFREKKPPKPPLVMSSGGEKWLSSPNTMHWDVCT